MKEDGVLSADSYLSKAPFSLSSSIQGGLYFMNYTAVSSMNVVLFKNEMEWQGDMYLINERMCVLPWVMTRGKMGGR